jgi:arylsulfatase A-like enzyme
MISILCLALAACTSLEPRARSDAAPAPRPDIVLLIADDLGRQDVGFMGGKLIKTPHLDKLAASGARLNQFYVQPVCSPTRAALMTGRYPMRLGLQVGVIRPTAQYGLDLEERTLAGALRDVGYTTAICGKWHLGSFDPAYWPNARGFDRWYGHLFGALDYFTHLRDGQHDWYRDGTPNHDKGYTTHLLAREAVQIIRDQPADRPLFLYVPFNAVHSPHQVPESYRQRYAGLKEPRRTYAGMLAALDEAVGQIVDAVEQAGRRGNTLFVFSSDNGGPAPGRVTDNGPFRAGKGTLYEGGVRVCAFASWDEKIPAGSQVDAPLHVVDWYPTLLGLAGASLDQERPIDGRDLWPCLNAGAPSPHDAILHNAAPAKGALRVGDWKLVLNGSAPEEPAAANAGRNQRAAAEVVELFNIAEDPYEKLNLADTRADKLAELRERYNAFAEEAVPPKNAGRRAARNVRPVD